MIQHILIPLDGSPVSEHALPPVIDILKPGGKVTLVTVGSPEQVVQMGGRDDAAVSLIQYLDQIANRMRLDGFEANVEIRSGDPAQVIVELAVMLGVDLIGMSASTRSGLERLLTGSITRAVLEAAPCPVLVVPQRIRERVEETQPARPDDAAPDLNPGLVT